MEFGMQLLRLVGSLALVLTLLFAFLYALRRWGGNRFRKATVQAAIEILSKQSFGPRHHLLLVKVPGEQSVLVGISPQNMSLLTINVPDRPEKVQAGEGIENI
ncbi:MAG: FliO/MopB family protein [Syntrophobacteraceae bacterium]